MIKWNKPVFNEAKEIVTHSSNSPYTIVSYTWNKYNNFTLYKDKQIIAEFDNLKRAKQRAEQE